MLSLEQRPPMRRCRSSFDEVAENGKFHFIIFVVLLKYSSVIKALKI